MTPVCSVLCKLHLVDWSGLLPVKIVRQHPGANWASVYIRWLHLSGSGRITRIWEPSGNIRFNRFSPRLCSYSSLFHFNGHYPDGCGLPGTRTSPFWILLKLRMTEVTVTTGAIRHAKLQSNHHKQTNTEFFLQARCPSRYATNGLRALKEISALTNFTNLMSCNCCV